jgi:hypothetical protein
VGFFAKICQVRSYPKYTAPPRTWQSRQAKYGYVLACYIRETQGIYLFDISPHKCISTFSISPLQVFCKRHRNSFWLSESDGSGILFAKETDNVSRFLNHFTWYYSITLSVLDSCPILLHNLSQSSTFLYKNTLFRPSGLLNCRWLIKAQVLTSYLKQI